MKTHKYHFVIEARYKGPSKSSEQGWRFYRSYKRLADAEKALAKLSYRLKICDLRLVIKDAE